MCGSSAAENQLQSQSSAFSNLLSSNYAQNFGAQSSILQNLTNQFTPIAQAGPDAQGFGPQQLAALNTQAGEGVAANYAKAGQALNESQAAKGGGNEYLPNGAQNQLQASLASAGANQLSQEQLGITNANYTQGRQNYQNATAGLNALAGEYNPNAIAGQATKSNSSSFGQAKEINQQNQQWESDLAGIATGLVGGVGSFLTGGLSNLASGGSQAGSETGGGAEQFFSGGLSALQG